MQDFPSELLSAFSQRLSSVGRRRLRGPLKWSKVKQHGCLMLLLEMKGSCSFMRQPGGRVWVKASLKPNAAFIARTFLADFAFARTGVFLPISP